MPSVYKFLYGTNLRYLPLAYLLLPNLLAGCSALRKRPRSMGELNASPEWADVIQSDTFLKEIMDAAAALVFLRFGFGGGGIKRIEVVEKKYRDYQSKA